MPVGKVRRRPERERNLSTQRDAVRLDDECAHRKSRADGKNSRGRLRKSTGLFCDQVVRVDVIAVQRRVVVLDMPDKLLGSRPLRKGRFVHKRDGLSLS